MKIKINLLFILIMTFNLYADSEIGGKVFLDKYPTKKLNWDDAKKYCEEIGGRLPSISEFESVYKIVKNSSDFFKGKRFWTLDEHKSINDKAYYFYFDVNNVKYRSKKSTNYVRCIK